MSSSVTTSGVPRGWGVDVTPRGDAPDGTWLTHRPGAVRGFLAQAFDSEKRTCEGTFNLAEGVVGADPRAAVTRSRAFHLTSSCGGPRRTRS